MKHRLVNGLQLKRLEAYGFKSFADRIEIEFGHGVTAVVGPNGSGKSNITDAIRWVLGEQNVRSLRGTKAEDIIFTGSAARRALGAAEVSLTLVNQGDLPVDFDEVVITRRLFRSGESEFYLNKTRCRLKDIYALLADTGLGHDGLSVISQNKMDAVLNSRPEERRLFFEETAGITKYRDRKRESVRKLNDTEANLVRVGDILQEIGTQLSPLAEEAERARRYHACQRELRQCKVTTLCRSLDRLERQRAESGARFDTCQAEELSAAAEVDRLEAEKEAAAKALLDMERRLQEKAGERNGLQLRLEQKKSDIRVLEDRCQQSDETQRRLKDQRNALEEEGRAAEGEHARLSEAEQTLLTRQKEAETKLTAMREQAARLSAETKRRRLAAEALSLRRAETQKTLLNRQKELALLEHDLASGHETTERQSKDAALLETRIDEARARLAVLTERANALAEEQETLRRAQKVCEEERRTIEGLQKRRQQELRTAQQYVDNAAAKREILQRMQQAYEGFGHAAKCVLTAHEPWRRGICGAVAELVRIPAKYLTAAEAALGGAQQNIVTEDTDTAKAAIAYLKEKRAGRVTFLPLSTLTARGMQDSDVRRLPGVIGYMNEVIETEERYRKAMDFLLARTLLVDTMDHALAAARRQGYRVRIVTLSGELLHPGGSISGGSLPGKETGFLNRGGEIEALGRAIDEQKERIATAERAYQEAARQAQNLEAQYDERKEALESARVKAAETRVERDALARQTDADNTHLAALRELTRETAKTFAEAQEKRVLSVRAVRELNAALADVERELETARDTLSDLEQDADDLGKLLNTLARETEEIKMRALKSRSDVLLKEKDIERLQKAVAENREEAARLLESLHEEAGRIARQKEEHRALAVSLEAAESAYQALHQKRAERLTEAHALEEAAGAARRARAKAQERLHQIEMETEKLRFQIEQNLRTLQEEYRLSVEEAAETALDLDADALSARTRALERSLAELGSVNLNAIEEHQRLSERYRFIERQSKDLYDAKAKLLEIIQEMDAIMTKQFKAAFADIRLAFHEIFTALFGGGEARLLLTDERSVLDAGVEIEVRLPDKKQQNLSVLSGGERALTVIALLFSFLRVRPAPFSVLDEIDAPLDEANIARFGRFLREFAEKTQFVVVTHRKGTMEAADTMYGVTLEDAGVSKIISVKLDEIPA